MTYLGTIGTAGHIDHGKSSLVLALTGVETDRLAEEKARGITIELGFAPLDLDAERRAGVVDVPGHEGFVRTMVAGASGVDVGLLVIAADEGLMPQTREHVAVLRFLGVARLVVALSKCDLVEGDWLELVEEDVRSFLSTSPWPEAPFVRTSIRGDGAGLDALKQALAAVLGEVGARGREDLVRLPVDRVFTVRGTGTVITGTLWSGSVAVGERLFPKPSGEPVRVRGIEVHGQAVERAYAGQRTALAVSGDTDSLRRGAVLTSAEGWEPSQRLSAEVSLLEEAPPLQRGRRVRLHLGTSEVVARVLPLHGDTVAPGETAWVELRLVEPVLARNGDRFVLRSITPVHTVGGGTVAEPHPPRRPRKHPISEAQLALLLRGGPEERLRVVLERGGSRGVPETLLPVWTGLPPELALAGLPRVGAAQRGGRAYAAVAVAAVREDLERWVRSRIQADPLDPGAPLEAARASLEAGELAELALEGLVQDGVLEVEAGWVRPPGYRPEPGPEDEARLRGLLAAYGAAGLETASVEAVAEGIGESDPWPLTRYLERAGSLVRLEDGIYVDAETALRAQGRVQRELGGAKGLGPMDFKEVLPVSRRHLLPFLGYLDRIGVTARGPDGRDVAPEEGDS